MSSLDPSSKKKQTLGLCVSTMNGQLLRNTELVSQIQELGLETVVVNQHGPDPGSVLSTDLWAEAPHVTVVNAEARGVSQSRNVGLHSLHAHWAVLCDDDVTLDREGLEALTDLLDGHDGPAHELVVAGELWYNASTPWRKYVKEIFTLKGASIQNALAIQRINSMELVVPTPNLKSPHMPFHPGLGLGSTGGVLAGEEVVYLQQHLAQGGHILRAPIRIRFHEQESTGSSIQASTIQAMGAVHRHIFPWWLAPFLVVKMTWKWRGQGAGWKNNLWAYLRGMRLGSTLKRP